MDIHFERDASEVLGNLGRLNKRFSGRKILLTGAAGFLGAHFIHYFLKLNASGRLSKPCTLYAWDNYIRGMPDWMKSLRRAQSFQMAKKDIRNPGVLPRVDYIIHAASIASPIYYRKHPIETMDANVTGIRLLLEHARRTSPTSLLFFSSSEIYGDPDPGNIPTSEEYWGHVSCMGPRACYDESKRYGETLCVNFHRVHKVPVKIARPFNNFGPGLKITDRRVIPDFFQNVLNNQSIRLLSNGKATRTFCYISDAISGYLRLLLSSHEGEAFNIGSESPEISMKDLAEEVIRVSGKKLKVIFQKSRDPDYLRHNPQRRCPSLQKAYRLLGYQPAITLREGLRRMYDYYLDQPGGTDQ